MKYSILNWPNLRKRETTTEQKEFDNNERRYLISVIRRHFSYARSQLLYY